MQRLGILLSVGLIMVLGAVHMYRLETRLGELEQIPRVDPKTIDGINAELTLVKVELVESRGTIREASSVKQDAMRLADKLVRLQAEVDATEQSLERHDAELRTWEEFRKEVNSAVIDRRLGELRDGIEMRWQDVHALANSAIGMAKHNGQDLDLIKHDLERDQQRMWRELVGPTVQLAGDTTVGSGVLLESRLDPDAEGAYVTWLITSWHVVRDIQAGLENVDVPVPITIYLESGNRLQETAQLIEFDPVIDAALLKLNSTFAVECGARLASRERLANLQIFEPVYAVGCPLGNDPIPTSGAVTSLQNPIGDANYWMINAPGYFGNSGGGVFGAEDHQLIGVYSKVYTYKRGVVSHMGLIAPVTAIHEWLARENLDHVLRPRPRLDLTAVIAAAPAIGGPARPSGDR